MQHFRCGAVERHLGTPACAGPQPSNPASRDEPRAGVEGAQRGRKLLAVSAQRERLLPQARLGGMAGAGACRRLPPPRLFPLRGWRSGLASAA